MKLIERTRKALVYAIRCKRTKRWYIGATATPISRRSQHFTELRANRHPCRQLQQAFNEGGEQQLEWVSLESVEGPPASLEKKVAACELKWMNKTRGTLLLNNDDSIGYRCRPEDHLPGLADKLKEARAASGLSQIEAGQKAGVHHVSIAKFETDKSTPTLRVLIKLADAYDVTVVDLLPESLTKRASKKARKK